MSLQKGLVGHWPLDRESLQSATIFADKTPYENAGTSANAPVFTTDRMGQSDRAMTFIATNSDNVRIPDSESLSPTTAMTAMIWVKGAAQNDGRFFTHWDTGATQRAFGIVTTDFFIYNKLKVFVSDDGSYSPGHRKRYDSSIVVFDNTWHLVGFTFDTGTLKLFIDGVEDTNPTKVEDDAITTIHNSTADVMIGCDLSSDTPTDFFNGDISGARIYDRALSPTEITMLYEQYRPKIVISPAFEFDVNNTQTISGVFSTASGRTIRVDWGDGTETSYSGTDQAWSHDYGSAGNHTVRMYKSVYLTKFTMEESGADISFDLAKLPRNVTYFRCYGSNTVSGDIANLPTGLTYFRCEGSNTVSGDINLPTGLTYFRCSGSNTVSGDIANLPTGLTVFNCYGSNTVLGDLANLPTGLTVFNCSGSNTVSDYTTPHTWTTNFSTFRLVPVGAGGLSTAEIDNLLIDFDADLVWASGNTIILTGTNAARSAASDAAVANMEAEGASVTTN